MHPACGDDGTAIGAALLHWHHFLKQPRRYRPNKEAMYSCRTYEDQIPGAVTKYINRLSVRQGNDYIKDAAN